jgi:hypothetical protein
VRTVALLAQLLWCHGVPQTACVIRPTSVAQTQVVRKRVEKFPKCRDDQLLARWSEPQLHSSPARTTWENLMLVRRADSRRLFTSQQSSVAVAALGFLLASPSIVKAQRNHFKHVNPPPLRLHTQFVAHPNEANVVISFILPPATCIVPCCMPPSLQL